MVFCEYQAIIIYLEEGNSQDTIQVLDAAPFTRRSSASQYLRGISQLFECSNPTVLIGPHHWSSRSHRRSGIENAMRM